MSRFMQPNFGFADELRLVFRDAGSVWGALALFRGPDDRAFATPEVEFTASLTASFARVYVDRYVPRMGAELSPDGWFTQPAG